MRKMSEMSRQVGYDILNMSNDKINPEMDYKENQKVVMFSTSTCVKKKKIRDNRLIISFKVDIKNCSVIYLSQSFYKTLKDIPLNCSHYCVYEFPSSRERNMISDELGVNKEKFKTATKEPYSFLYVDKPMKTFKKDFFCII